MRRALPGSSLVIPRSSVVSDIAVLLRSDIDHAFCYGPRWQASNRASLMDFRRMGTVGA
jgi:hypothetical protein